MLSVEAYNTAEAAASDRFPIRVNQAFFPEMFATVGYPVRVERLDQLWRYIDVMQEDRAAYNMDELLHGLTPREFDLFKQVTGIVDKHAQQHFGRRAHATSSLTRALHVLRLIKLATGDARPAVLEIGPGCGYLGMLLVLEGYPYISTDVTQAFYLYQSQMLAHVATDFRELAVDDGDILSIETPKPGTAIHIPWWKWVTMTPDDIKLSAGIMTSNHCLCEMHPSSMGYLAAVSSRILARHPGGGRFVFDEWGYNLLHSEHSIVETFAGHGFRLCHNEVAVSAMALAAETAGWEVYGGRGGVAGTAAAPAPAPRSPSQTSDILRAGLDAVPALKPILRRLLAPWRNLPTGPTPGNLASYRFPYFRGDNPLSKALTDGRQAVMQNTTVQKPALDAFLADHFGGQVPANPDEVFFRLTRVVL